MDVAPCFAEIYRQHAAAVYRLAWLLSGDRHEAEDLTSECFARALGGDGAIRQATVRSYLYAIVRNLVASRQRRPAIELPADDERLADMPDAEPDPEQRADLRQRLAQASNALAALREPERQVLVLCGVHGMDAAEMSDALGIDAGAVRVRLHRARRALARLLEPAPAADSLPDTGSPHGSQQGVRDEPA
jgi:RNA polymerase sigma factor (sigma-70 family)